MDLDNDTPFAARLLWAQLAEDADVQATLVVKATFERAGDRGWVPVGGQVPIIDDRLDTPFGTFHGDGFVRKDGVDVCVLGTIRPQAPVRSQALALAIDGRTAQELIAFGDRRWVRAGGRLVPSSPEPFSEMPLGYSRAYGGATEHDYETMVWPDNPVGRGYYLSDAAAENHLLPNIEAKAGPHVAEWTDQPVAAGWGPYPCYWGIRAREGVEPPEKPRPGEFGKIKARLNNNAHPALILPALRDDAEIRVRGMRKQELTFVLPRFAPEVEIQLGDTRRIETTSTLDGVFLWTDIEHVTLTRRVQFTYPYNRGQVRRARLRDRAAGAASSGEASVKRGG